MKIKIYTTLLLIFCTLILTSCYREDAVVNSYTVDKKEFNFNAKGGTETANLLIRGGRKIKKNEIDWQYIGCYSPKPTSEYKVEMKVESLTDGTLKISNEWITFTSPKDRKTIKIETKENTTGKERIIHFDAASLAVGFTLTVKQDK